MISPEAKLSGDIRVGAGCVIHPKALLLAEGGPILLGRDNIVEEQSIIINRPSPSAPGAAMRIGDSNHFHVGCQVLATAVGNSNAFHVRSEVSEGSVVGNGCVIGAAVKVAPNTTVPDATMVYGPQAQSNPIPNAVQAHLALHSKELELLHKLFKRK